jgi:hypothetical protein
MTLKELACAAFVAAGSVAAFADTPALAQNATPPDPGPSADSYVSAAGSDDNLCTISKPCLTIGHAIGRTMKEGTVHCLDSFGNDALSITQSITIARTRPRVWRAFPSTDRTSVCISLVWS